MSLNSCFSLQKIFSFFPDLFRLIFLMVCAVPFSSHAVTCSLYPGPAASLAIPLASPTIASSTIGADYSMGSPVGIINTKSLVVNNQLRCTAASVGTVLKWTAYMDVVRSPYGISSYAASNKSPVFNTPVSGVGFSFNAGGTNSQSFPVILTTSNYTYTSTSEIIYKDFINLVNWGFVKTKNGVIGNGVITGNDLPTYKIYLVIESPTGTQTLTIVPELSFSGTTTFNSYTCQTSDLVVPLGEHDLNEFHGIGSSLPWVDASIKLTNCPQSYSGVNSSSGGQEYSMNTSSFVSMPVIAQNSIKGIFMPSYGQEDSVPGGIKIQSGQGMASGVAVQMATGDVSSSTPLTYSSYLSFPVTVSTGTEQKIPLVARLIQVSSPLSPGQIRSTMSFSINYY